MTGSRPIPRVKRNGEATLPVFTNTYTEPAGPPAPKPEAAFAPSGAQLGNVYRATPEGIALARTFTREKPKRKAE